MLNDDILILKGNEVASLLEGHELEIIQAVRKAYEAHGRGDDSLPHSTFLRFPHDASARIIALPAYLGNDVQTAGIKWIASFPSNLEKGMDRASAVIILSSIATGRPEAIIEGSVISAQRTAASAALAAQILHKDKSETHLGLVGCGLISFEIARFILASRPEIRSLIIYDKDPQRAIQFKENCHWRFGPVEIQIAEDIPTVFKSSCLISLATTAVKPHIFDLSDCKPGTTILHISLRDISPDQIIFCDNVVDDVDHVCRAETSVHLAEQLVSNRNFMRCTLADVLLGAAGARKNGNGVTIFSPFGLGILDIAVSKFVHRLALNEGRGTVIQSFLPDSWIRKN